MQAIEGWSAMGRMLIWICRGVLLALAAVVACGGGSESGDTQAARPVELECETLGYPCSLADVPLEILERGNALADEAITMLGADSSMAEVASWLREQTDVVEVQADDEAVRYRLDGGRGFWIYGSGVFGTLGAPGEAAQHAPAARFAHIVGPQDPAKQALVLSPMFYEFGDIDESATVASILEGTRGYEGGVKYKYNDHNAPGLVDLDAYRDWDKYDVIHLSTHGKRICDEGACRASLAAATLEQLAPGVGQSEAEKMQQFQVKGLEIVKGQTTGRIYVVLTSDFFKNEYGGGLADSLIFINACQIFGVQATDIADALKGNSSVFVGWTESVYVSEATATAIAFYTELSKGYTPEVARGLIGDLVLGTAAGPHPAPSLIVGGRRDDDGLRIRDIVWVEHPETGEVMMPGATVKIDGEAGDGQDDLVPYSVQVDGIKPEEAADATVHIEIGGVEAEPRELIDEVVDGEDHWTLTGDLDMGRDVQEGEEVSFHAWVELPEGGESHHEVSAKLTAQRTWQLHLSYSRLPTSDDGFAGSPDSAEGTLFLALADFQNPSTPNLESYEVVGGTMTVNPSSKDRFCIVEADSVTFDVTPGMTGISELAFDTSKSPVEYRLYINITGPEYEADYSCRAGTGEQAPEGYQDPVTRTERVSLLMLDISLDEHRQLSSDGVSASGTWIWENRSNPGAIRTTDYSLVVGG